MSQEKADSINALSESNQRYQRMMNAERDENIRARVIADEVLDGRTVGPNFLRNYQAAKDELTAATEAWTRDLA